MLNAMTVIANPHPQTKLPRLLSIPILRVVLATMEYMWMLSMKKKVKAAVKKKWMQIARFLRESAEEGQGDDRRHRISPHDLQIPKISES
jgi:Flp pilus assembly protein TadG